MKRAWQRPAKVLAGLLGVALYAMPQGYTISARPGVVNYIEGTAYLDGKQISDTSSGRTFLTENAALATENGKAEILLTPGVFLRLGPNSEVRMISPTLTNTKVELTKGSAMVEVAELVKENEIQILDHGAITRLEKIGLYRFTADGQPTAAVLDGKAEVELNDKKVDVGKGREVVLAAGLRPEHFDTKDNQDDLYAWSKTRDQYASAASYSAAKNVGLDNWSSGGWGYGFSGFSNWGGPGWAFNPAFGSYAWLPGDGAFFSPFGYGFFAPGAIAYAPVAYVPISGYRGGAPVAVNPGHLPFAGGSRSGLSTASGAPVRSGNFGHHGGWSGGHGAWAGAHGGAGHVAGNSYVAGGGGMGARSADVPHVSGLHPQGSGPSGHAAGGGFAGRSAGGGGGYSGHAVGGGGGGGGGMHGGGGGGGGGAAAGGGGGMHGGGGGGGGARGR